MVNAALTESTFYILLSLIRPQHGYGIMQQVEGWSRGRVRLAAGTLYGALTSMNEKGWIVQLPVEDGSRRKEYRLTAAGEQMLREEIDRLKELVSNADAVMKENEPKAADAAGEGGLK